MKHSHKIFTPVIEEKLQTAFHHRETKIFKIMDIGGKKEQAGLDRGF